MLSWNSIEQGLDRLLELVRSDRRVQQEFERSRAEFFTDPAAAGAPLAELRHLEWFLLERPSTALGTVPAQAWQAEWCGSSPSSTGELSTSVLQSIPGAFEVTALVLPEGLWLRDLFTLGEHPVAETRATVALEVGDLLVGRLFPAGGGTFLLSPSVSVFRNKDLVAAVRSDLAEMRAVRRGVLRVQQLELERLFHGPTTAGRVEQQVAEVRARAQDELRKQGLEPRTVEQIVERVREAAAASKSPVIMDILNGLAFETGVDLDPVRLALVELWDCEQGFQVERNMHVRDHVRDSDAIAALEAFDRGRAEGKDLEQLFGDLERDLGVDDEEEETSQEEGRPAADFSGVIGAMVEEFLWEVEREQGAERAEAWGVLRTLGDYGRDICTFEELGHARLLDFSARWLLDESGLANAAAVETLIEALAVFCHWCEDHHDLPLWRQFGTTLDSLRASVPRHLALRQKTAAAGRGSYRVVKVAEGAALVRDDKGGEQSIAITPHQAAHLCAGDLVRLSMRKGEPALGATYPPELASLRSHSR